MNHLSIFPTPLEQLRVIAQYFDLTIPNKKALDDKAHDKNMRLELMWSYINDTWYKPLKTLLPDELAESMNRHFCRYISHYLKMVGDVDVSGVSRKELMDILIKYFFPADIYLFLMDGIPSQYQFPDVIQLFNYERKSVETVLNWLKDDPTWYEYLSQLDKKEDKDRIERWRRGEYLPSFQAIKLLSKEKTHDWVKIKFWLLIARALDDIRHNGVKDVFNCLNFISYIERDLGSRFVPDALDMLTNKALYEIRQESHHLIMFQLDSYKNLCNLLSNSLQEKSEKVKDDAFRELNVARSIAESINRLEYETYIWDKMEARWHLFAGNLEKAIELYKKSFEQGLFCAGSNLKFIIQEAIVTTAYFEKSTGNSQRKLLAHLKNAMVMFSYEMPSFEQPTEKLNHKETVADWEVNMWANEFHRFFPRNSYFPNVDYPYLESSTHGYVTFEEVAQTKPDYKKPNKMINWQGKRMPQLVLHVLLHDERHEDYGNRLEYVQMLLANKADVNQLSSSNESALLLALEHMDLDETKASQDRRLFDLIKQYPHKKETVNAKTAKLEKYPLMQAVLTGRPDVVKTILEMGADADQVNYANTTPLYCCLTMMGKLSRGELKSKEIFKQVRDKSIYSEIQQEANRRYHAAYHGTGSGAVYFQNRMQLKNDEHNRLYNMMIDAMFQIQFENYAKYTSLEKLQEIVELLLKNGADPNYPHNLNGMNGYTPLMMAVEINNPVVFELLKQYGGDISLCGKTRNGYRFSCHDVKRKWKSDKIHL